MAIAKKCDPPLTVSLDPSLFSFVTALVYVVICLIWGSTWLAIKIGLSDAPPFTTAALRFILSTSILGGMSLVRKYTYPRDIKGLLHLGYPGLYMYGLSYAFVYFGQQFVNSATSAILFASFPFFVAVFSWSKYRKEKLSLKAWGGMALGFLGVGAISYDSLQTSNDIFLGTILVLMASASAAYGVVIHKQKHSDVNIVVAANVQMICGGLLLIVMALSLESWSDFTVTTATVGSIVYLAVFGTVVTFLGYYWLLKRTRVTVVSLIAFITPLIAILLGILLAEEQLAPLIVAGSCMILAGVLLVVRKWTGVDSNAGV